MLLEHTYVITTREGDLPFDDIEAKLRSMSEVRAVPTRPPGTYLMSEDAEHADIVLGMLPERAPNLPACAGYVFLERPSYVALYLRGANAGAREALVGFLEWLAERCPFAVHDEQGRYASDIDDKGLSAFLVEPWE